MNLDMADASISPKSSAPKKPIFDINDVKLVPIDKSIVNALQLTEGEFVEQLLTTDGNILLRRMKKDGSSQ